MQSFFKNVPKNKHFFVFSSTNSTIYHLFFITRLGFLQVESASLQANINLILQIRKLRFKSSAVRNRKADIQTQHLQFWIFYNSSIIKMTFQSDIINFFCIYKLSATKLQSAIQGRKKIWFRHFFFFFNYNSCDTILVIAPHKNLGTLLVLILMKYLW